MTIISLPSSGNALLWQGPLIPTSVAVSGGGSGTDVEKAHKEAETYYNLIRQHPPTLQIGQPQSWALQELCSTESLSSMLRRELERSQLHVVRLNCGFLPPSRISKRNTKIPWANWRITSADFEVTLFADTPNASPIAFDVFPSDVRQMKEGNVTLTINPKLKIHEIEASVGEFGFSLQLPRPKPFIFSVGVGTSSPTWSYQDEQGIAGDKWMFMLVKAPLELESAWAGFNVSALLDIDAPLPRIVLKPFAQTESLQITTKLW